MNTAAKHKILFVEDEHNVGATLSERLSDEGYDTTWVTSVEDAKLEIQHRRFDLALLDVGLPDGTGFDVAQKVRDHSTNTAIIFLTAFGTPEDRVKGLSLGAEDYILKPFHLKELLLRIKNGLRRANYHDDIAQQTLQLGRATIDLAKFEITANNETNQLTQKEAAVLRFLLERRGKAVTRDEILNHVWAEDEYPSSRTIDNFILRLRKIIEDNPRKPQIITSIRGVGYKLV